MSIDNVNADKDYVLSCATLFSELGFPKAAFIKMIGPEYASDVFELVSEERMFLKNLVFIFPRRNSWKKRIDQKAKQHFFNQIVHEVMSFLNPFVTSYFDPLDYQQITCAELREFSNIYQDRDLEFETEQKIKKYHRNLGSYLSKTLERSVNKMPLSEKEARCTYSLLVCYYSIIRDYESVEITLKKIANIDECIV